MLDHLGLLPVISLSMEVFRRESSELCLGTKAFNDQGSIYRFVCESV